MLQRSFSVNQGNGFVARVLNFGKKEQLLVQIRKLELL